ncbi:transketolase family protein [Solidesulfovibrio carbinolicus]|uniref:Transketolase n=1 Tax=Solidesulfovibrio carbinolicus TaxID=296842 RepID=A0A4P6I673_9BACT|nr:transketolase C-terminal domain-containing protein [Solidesulfovibrio carbinolicus]QAZ69629.1 transketolase [Solidesulfovibrio carbinolicus]
MENMRDAFGKALTRLAGQRDDFVVLDADVAGGTGTHHFRAAYPDRFIQCAIAEQNMFSMAAGLASTGVIPIVTCYGVFASMRALEQARNSIAYPGFKVIIAASHLGLDVGPDGATHQALEDIAIYRAVPGIQVVSPADPHELASVLPRLLDGDSPVYLRTGRSPLPDVFAPDTAFDHGRAQVLHEGRDTAILAVGVMVHRAVAAARRLQDEGVGCRVLNMSWLKPMDEAAVLAAARETGALVTCEDHNKYGGLGGAVAEIVGEGHPVPLRRVAIQDVYGESGDPDDLAAKYGLTTDHIMAAVRAVLRRKG